MLSLLVALLTIGAVFGNIPGKRCWNDIVFVLDESGSIYGPDFTQQLDFVQAIIGKFDIGFNMTHIGVLTFGTSERIIFPLGKYTNQQDLKAAVKAIRQRRGDTYTHLALKRTCQQMFSIKYSRPWVRHVVIVITDGDSHYPQETKKEADRCRQKEIQMIAIGVGEKVHREELNAIATSNDLVFMVDDYKALETLGEKLADEACEPCRKKIDHIWAISEFAGVSETNYALNFIKKVTKDMKIDPLFVQVGLAPRYYDEGDDIHLKDHGTKEGFWRDLDNYQLTGLFTNKTIEYLRLNGITAANGARSDADKFGILILDFEPEDWVKTQREALRAKIEGIRLMVIGVGDNIREDQLRQLAWSNEDYFYARTYSQLDDLENALFQRICEVQEISNAIQGVWHPWESFFEDFYSEEETEYWGD